MSNFIGQNDFANLAHRNKVFTDPAVFNHYTGVDGEIAFLICNGYSVGAIFNGVCPGGVMRWQMFNSAAVVDNANTPDVFDLQSQIDQLQAALPSSYDIFTSRRFYQHPEDYNTTLNLNNPFLANRIFHHWSNWADFTATGKITLPTDYADSGSTERGIFVIAYELYEFNGQSPVIDPTMPTLMDSNVLSVTLLRQRLTFIPRNAEGKPILQSAEWVRNINLWEIANNNAATTTYQANYDEFEVTGMPANINWTPWARVY